jgi:proteasome accessory factor B
VPAGPAVIADPPALAVAQGAIMAGACIEFEYLADGASEPKWRRVVPYGLVHGPITYLIGKLPGRDAPPVPFRLDRMQDVRASNLQECPPEDWDLDAWMAQSFGIWREDDHDIVLRVLPAGVARAKQWRFHPGQEFEEVVDGSLIVRFRTGGLREIAEHLFTWGGDVVIVGPEALKNTMTERLAAGLTIVNSEWGQA